jgi:hypothetical protein
MQPMNINSVVPNMVDRTPWRWWDVVNVPTGTTIPATINPFAVPIGATDPITSTQKTKLQTNMVRGNQFPPPWCIIMRRLQFSFSPSMVLADILALYDAMYLEFKIDQKIFWEGYLQDFPGGSGLTGVATQSGVGLFQNGMPAPNFTMDYGQYAKYIAPTQQFSLQLIFPATPPTLSANGTVGWKMRCIIDGLVDRPVQ